MSFRSYVKLEGHSNKANFILVYFPPLFSRRRNFESKVVHVVTLVVIHNNQTRLLRVQESPQVRVPKQLPETYRKVIVG